jgi:hypothetical protein
MFVRARTAKTANEEHESERVGVRRRRKWLLALRGSEITYRMAYCFLGIFVVLSLIILPIVEHATFYASIPLVGLFMRIRALFGGLRLAR